MRKANKRQSLRILPLRRVKAYLRLSICRYICAHICNCVCAYLLRVVNFLRNKLKTVAATVAAATAFGASARQPAAEKQEIAGALQPETSRRTD